VASRLLLGTTTMEASAKRRWYSVAVSSSTSNGMQCVGLADTDYVIYASCRPDIRGHWMVFRKKQERYVCSFWWRRTRRQCSAMWVNV